MLKFNEEYRHSDDMIDLMTPVANDENMSLEVIRDQVKRKQSKVRTPNAAMKDQEKLKSFARANN